MDPNVPPQSAEEEEFQLALAISRSAAESKQKEMVSGAESWDMDPELQRYLDRNYWQQKSDAVTAPSAPHPAPPAQSSTSRAQGQASQSQDTGADGVNSSAAKAQFLSALSSSLEIFQNRMRSNSQRGRPIANDSSVQSLFTVISNMHPQLVKYQQDVEDKRAYYEGLQDKLTQLRDAREALDSLRDEHREKRRREQEELERQRQIQMMHKLEVMRQKKQEYLEVQRQLALQRLQEHEREMALRLEQQKHLTHLRHMHTYGYPQMYGQPQTMGQTPGMVVGPPHLPPSSLTPQGPAGHQHAHGAYMPGPQPLEGPSLAGVNGYVGTVVCGAGPGTGVDTSLTPAGPLYGQPGVSNSPYSQMSGGQAGQGQIHPSAHLQLDGPGTAGGGAGQGFSLPYPSMPPTMDYGSFNMQGLASSLPQPPSASSQPVSGYPTSSAPAHQQPAQSQFYTTSPSQYPAADRTNNYITSHNHLTPPQHSPMPQFGHVASPQSMTTAQNMAPPQTMAAPHQSHMSPPQSMAPPQSINQQFAPQSTENAQLISFD